MRMRLLAGFVVCGIAGLSAMSIAAAADLPDLKSPPAYVPPPQFSWTGFYAGVNAGYGLDHASYPYLVEDNSYTLSRSGLTERGPAVGGQVGFDYQFSNLPLLGDHLVVGVEADADWSDINGASTPGSSVGPVTFGTRIQNFGGISGRIGYTFDRLLVFFNGGRPFATTEAYYTAWNLGLSNAAVATRFKNVLCGGGLEYAFDDHWSARVDYRYTYIGAWWQDFNPTPGHQIAYMSRTSFHTVRLGIDYRFDLFAPPTPTVSKY